MTQTQLLKLLQVGIQISDQMQESPSRTGCLSRGSSLGDMMKIFMVFCENCDQLSPANKRKLGFLLFSAEVKKDILVNFEVYSRRLRVSNLLLGTPIRIFYGKEPKDRKRCPIFRADNFHLIVPEYYLKIEEITQIHLETLPSPQDDSSNKYLIQCRNKILLHLSGKTISTSKGKICWIPHSGKKVSSRDHLLI